jgi:N-methylhydantoinase B
MQPGDQFTRPSAGGGGLGDPTERSPAAVLEDIIDGYVTQAGAARDYGVIVREVDAELDQWEIDHAATEAARAKIRLERNAWLSTDPQSVAARLRDGEISIEEAIRRYGVICDWNDGSLLPKTTEQFRAAMRMRGAGR